MIGCVSLIALIWCVKLIVKIGCVVLVACGVTAGRKEVARMCCNDIIDRVR